MRLLVFHNILFAQYKSVYFEALSSSLKKGGGELLVVQSSLAEKSRLNHFNSDDLIKSVKYPFKLISHKPLEEVKQLKVLLFWLKSIHSFKPHAINFTGYNSIIIFITLCYCRILGIKTIITSESVLKKNSNLNTLMAQLNRMIKKLITRQADRFYTFGINANNLLFDLDVPKHKILNFGNTFNKKQFGSLSVRPIQSKTPKLLFVGRLIEEKNLFQTIEVLAKVNQLIPIEFSIVGDGPLETNLKTFCQHNNFQFVNFMEPVKWDQIGKLYPQYEYLVLFSNSETWGMVANEAQYFNLKVLCTANCGCANDLVIHPFNGLVLKDLANVDTPSDIATYLSNSGDSFNFTERNNMIFDESYAIKSFIERLVELNES